MSFPKKPINKVRNVRTNLSVERSNEFTKKDGFMIEMTYIIPEIIIKINIIKIPIIQHQILPEIGISKSISNSNSLSNFLLRGILKEII